MEMTSCHVCGKIFGTSSGVVCPACRKLLDIVYEKARAYLRDHPNDRLNTRELSEAIDEDERLVEILMIEGRFDSKDNGGLEDSEVEKKRKRLLEDLQKSLLTPSHKSGGITTYGRDRYGKDRP
ncbi:MAG: hypothetical protein FWE55_00215 [Synergistaceae bacterium]|nr:hypothetical protein [Synergistaceae bacterium]